MIERLYVTMSSYLMGKIMGHEAAVAKMKALCTVDALTGPPPIPGILTIRHLKDICEIAAHLDTGSAHLSKLRSKHFTAAFDSGLPWLTVDDDVEASERTLRWMLEAIDTSEPTVVIGPCLFRGKAIVNVEYTKVYSTRRLSDGGVVRTCERGGAAFMAVNRPAMARIAAQAPEFLDDGGKPYYAAFLEYFCQGGQWLSEDLSFCQRCRALGIAIEALQAGETAHDGAELPLARLSDI